MRDMPRGTRLQALWRHAASPWRLHQASSPSQGAPSSNHAIDYSGAQKVFDEMMPQQKVSMVGRNIVVKRGILRDFLLIRGHHIMKVWAKRRRKYRHWKLALASLVVDDTGHGASATPTGEHVAVIARV
nr:unnamed protein product [Digitaria exilis]